MNISDDTWEQAFEEVVNILDHSPLPRLQGG